MLDTAQKAREALATDLAQAQEALESFELMVRKAQEKEAASQAKLEKHRTNIKEAILAIGQSSKVQAATGSDVAIMAAARQVHRVLPFMHLFAFPPKERVTNRQTFCFELTDTFELTVPEQVSGAGLPVPMG